MLEWSNFFFITHTKWHYGWKNPYQILKVKESIKEDSEDIFIRKGSIKRMLIEWEWGTNEYIFLSLLWSCGVISSGNSKTGVKWTSYFGHRRVIKTPSLVTLLSKMTTNVRHQSYILGWFWPFKESQGSNWKDGYILEI